MLITGKFDRAYLMLIQTISPILYKPLLRLRVQCLDLLHISKPIMSEIN